jgi:hypothetical protein
MFDIHCENSYFFRQQNREPLSLILQGLNRKLVLIFLFDDKGRKKLRSILSI